MAATITTITTITINSVIEDSKHTADWQRRNSAVWVAQMREKFGAKEHLLEYMTVERARIIAIDPTNEREVVSEPMARCALFMCAQPVPADMISSQHRRMCRRRLWAWLSPLLWRWGTAAGMPKGYENACWGRGTYFGTRNKYRWIAQAVAVVHQVNNSGPHSAAAMCITHFSTSHQWHQVTLRDIILLEKQTDVPGVAECATKMRHLYYRYATRGMFGTCRLTLNELQRAMGAAAQINSHDMFEWLRDINRNQSKTYSDEDLMPCKYWCRDAARGGNLQYIREKHGDQPCPQKDKFLGDLLGGYRSGSMHHDADQSHIIGAVDSLLDEFKCCWSYAECHVGIRMSHAWNAWTSSLPGNRNQKLLHHLLKRGCPSKNLISNVITQKNWELLRWLLRSDTGSGRVWPRTKPCFCKMRGATDEFVMWCRNLNGPPPDKIRQ